MDNEVKGGTEPFIGFTMDKKEADTLYAEIVRARNGLRYALKGEKLADAGYYFGWLDKCLTRLGQAMPDCVKCTAKQDFADDPQAGGGGNKPN